MAEVRQVPVVFSGGGTGGHLYPALALADALVEERPDVKPFFVGAKRGIEARVLPERGVDHVLLPVEGFQRTDWSRNRTVVQNLVRSVTQVGVLFRALRPELAVVTGGYAGGPAGLMALAMGVPLALQEQNAFPGATIRALSLRARQIHLAFPEAAERLPARARVRVYDTGNPVRPAQPGARAGARAALGVGPDDRVLLVTGGSQGSRALNEVVAGTVSEIAAGTLARPSGARIVWSTGPKHYDGIQETLAGAGSPEWVQAVPYIDDMTSALAAADLALSRAGAMTTSEFHVWGLPSVLVPLPTAAEDHQRINAEALEQAGASIVVPEVGITPAALWSRVEPLLRDEEALKTMAEAASRRARPNAARDIARALAGLLPPGRRVSR
jgi:UDP-N-acetylglucosamine--N-acetylmuramyl-(pentapeptide) pyrophosphoryl-undecaprenol N-acetylglucosamine transferase